MDKQVMIIEDLSSFIVNTFGTSKVLVQKTKHIIVIEPFLTTKSESTIGMPGLNAESTEATAGESEKPFIDMTKAGALSLDDLTGVKLRTKGFKFNRDELYK
jgi:hypothetical protein